MWFWPIGLHLHVLKMLDYLYFYFPLRYQMRIKVVYFQCIVLKCEQNAVSASTVFSNIILILSDIVTMARIREWMGKKALPAVTKQMQMCSAFRKLKLSGLLGYRNMVFALDCSLQSFLLLSSDHPSDNHMKGGSSPLFLGLTCLSQFFYEHHVTGEVLTHKTSE